MTYLLIRVYSFIGCYIASILPLLLSLLNQCNPIMQPESPTLLPTAHAGLLLASLQPSLPDWKGSLKTGRSSQIAKQKQMYICYI